MGPFDTAPRGMRPGFFPNSGPRMMNMSGCRPPNPNNFQQKPPDRNDFGNHKINSQSSNYTDNCTGNMNKQSDNHQRGNFKNGENFGDKRFPGNGQFKQHNGGQSSNFQKNKGFQGNWNQNKKPKKQKIDKRELPENNKFSCDICERGFKTEEKYKEHTDGHVKCTYKDCTYVAAPKLVQLHVRMQHYSGLAKKIWSLESQEDIEKWRAERRKNFPTAENIEKKRALGAEKRARGEVLETKEFGKMNEQKNRRNRRKRKGQGSEDQRSEDKNEAKKAKVDCTKGEISTENGPVKAKSGSNTTTAGNSMDIGMEKRQADLKTSTTADPLSVLLTDSDSDSGDDGETKSAGETTGLQGGLGMILASYSNDQDTNTDNMDKKDENMDDGQVADTNNESKVNDLDGINDSKPSEKHSPKRNRRRGGGKVRGKNSKVEKKKWKHNKLFNNTKSSLLEKLLAKEIRHERNVILQCVYYIVKNNFFGAGKSTSSKDVKKDKFVGKASSVNFAIDDTACM